MVDNGGIWNEQSFRDFEINRDKDTIKQLETELAEARAEIERLQTELRQNADSCAETNLEIDWCKACTSRKWCAAGQSLVEAAERGE